MRNIAVIDEAFDSSNTAAYHLSILYGERNFSFAILDTVSLRYIAFKNIWFDEPIPSPDLTNHIRSILNTESYLTRTFKSIFFLYQTPLSVLIPSPLFRPENPEEYFRFSSLLLPSDKILFRRIPAIDAYVIFPIPGDLMNQVGFMLQNVQFFHQACPQIDEAFSESQSLADAAQVIANIHPGFADLLIIKSNQLILYNSFTIKNTDDLVFFILYLYEQFSLSQEESPVILSGYIEMYPGITEVLHQYLKNIVIRKLPGIYTYSQSFSGLTQHHLSPLINLARCE